MVAPGSRVRRGHVGCGISIGSRPITGSVIHTTCGPRGRARRGIFDLGILLAVLLVQAVRYSVLGSRMTIYRTWKHVRDATPRIG